jgi:hypothetical protein
MEVWSDKIRNRWRQIGKAAHVMVKEDHKMPMTDITIPPEAHSAAHRAFRIAHEETGSVGEAVDAACLAMLRAWPGMYEEPASAMGPKSIILPLTEPSNDK